MSWNFLLAAEEIAYQTGLPVGWNSFQISKSYAVKVLNKCQNTFQVKRPERNTEGRQQGKQAGTNGVCEADLYIHRVNGNLEM